MVCGLAAAAALALAMVNPHAALAAPSESSFFTGAGTTADGTATMVNDESVEAGGLQYGLYCTDDSEETSNFASADDVDMAKMNRSIIDVDNYRNLKLVLEVYNVYMNRHSAAVNDARYTGGTYHINLDQVKAAVRDSGYSVAPGSSERGLSSTCRAGTGEPARTSPTICSASTPT